MNPPPDAQPPGEGPPVGTASRDSVGQVAPEGALPLGAEPVTGAVPDNQQVPAETQESAPLDEAKDTAEGDHEDKYDLSFSPELFIGIARPLGTAGEAAVAELRNAFGDYGYHVDVVKISDLLEEDLLAKGETLSNKPDERTEALINEGDLACKTAKDDAAIAKKAVDEIRRIRREESDWEGDKTRRVFVIDSLKRHGEVKALRRLYGDHFITLGLRAADAIRRKRLLAELATRGTQFGARAVTRVDQLLEMDNDEDGDFGQQMTPTLAMSDVFICADTDREATRGIRRFVEILFGDPSAEQPSPEELGMQIARQVSVQSPELGLRVGAAILTEDGDVLATGYNHHPTTKGVPDYDAGAVDLRQLAQDTMRLLADGGLLVEDHVAKLEEDPDSFIRNLLAGPLKDSQLRQVTEFQRPVHAEMDAILSALRQQVDLDGGIVYVTDFPCHGCARHLVATNLPVVYLVPYEKSRASEMYGEEVDKFRPFIGVTPSRYTEWWVDGRSDLKDDLGRHKTWAKTDREKAVPKVNLLIDSRVIEDRERAEAGFD